MRTPPFVRIYKVGIIVFWIFLEEAKKAKPDKMIEIKVKVSGLRS